MAWIKNIMNRLFDKDKNEEFEENFDELELEEQVEEEHTEKPTFRFPIITDAEIYGWEPDSENEPRKEDSLITELDDDFTPVPLYKNDRWPGGNEQPTIHRSTSPNKYNTKQELTPGPVPKSVAATLENKEANRTTIIQKRSNRPFTPTHVPSPVYGYLRPKKEQVGGHEKEEAVAGEVAVNSKSDPRIEHYETEPANKKTVEENEFDRIDLEDHAHTFDKEKQIEFESERIIEWNSEKLEENANVEEMIASQLPRFDEVEVTQATGVEGHLGAISDSDIEEKTKPKDHLDSMVEIGSQPLDDESSIVEEAIQMMHEQNPIIEEETRLMNDQQTKAEEESQSVYVQNPIVEEEIKLTDDSNTAVFQEVETMDVLETNTNENNELLENLDSTTGTPIASTENPEPKKEKIVPFNVLMLKNDKMKYEERENRVSSQPPALHNLASDTQQAAVSDVNTELVEDNQDDVPAELENEPYYAFPSKSYLIQPEEHIEDTEWLQSQSEKLEEALSYFAVQANVIEAVQGPTVTRFELTVGHGTKVSKVRNLTDDLKLALAAEDIRIQAPIPGTSSIGIEIPNRKPRAVRISEVIETKSFQESTSPMEAVLGLSLTGEPVTLDLRKMPHGMIAGATGSGKSVCINSILISLLYKATPADLKMLLIDPKMVELAPFNGIPHLLSPVITDVKAATAALKWAVAEMERRYELFAHVGARNIERYNELAEKDRKFSLKMPYLLIVIDELADLMMMAPADVEVSIGRITQKARACGIHLIIATQRPSVDVITGTIKANVPTRIAFSVSSQIDSRTIIDTPGAERLLGKGDMLYLGNGQSSAIRLQGTFVTDAEIERIIEHVQNEAEPDYLFGQEDLLANIIEEEESDPLFSDACQFIITQGSASTSLLQRNFSIGYNRAAKLMDRMEKLGFISEQRGSKAREVYLTESEFDNYLNSNEKIVEM